MGTRIPKMLDPDPEFAGAKPASLNNSHKRVGDPAQRDVVIGI